MLELKSATTQYVIVTLNYWAFTLTDGALRLLVVLFFHGLGFSPLEIAGLFLLYEFFGVVTNLLGGWLATAIGLTITMQLGLSAADYRPLYAAGRQFDVNCRLCDGRSGALRYCQRPE